MTAKNLTQRQLLAQAEAYAKSVHTRYLAGIPRKPIPDGQCVVHNHVRPVGFPDVRSGQNGFRFWCQDVDLERLELCECDWAPGLERHYRVKRPR